MMLFLHGPDTYRSAKKLREIVGHYQNIHQTAIHIRNIDCAHAEFFDFKNEVETISMFERKKLIILRNIFQNEGFAEQIVAYKDALVKSDNHIIVFLEEGEVKGKTKNTLYQFLRKHAKAQEFALLTHSQLRRWAEKEFEGFGVHAGPKVIEMLIASTGSDLWQLSNEIQKLVTFQAPGTGKPIREADAALFITPKLEADIFGTIDALSQKNKKRAFGLLYRHLEKGDSPYYIISMFVYQFRTLLEIKDMVERKIPYGAMVQNSTLHPYALKKGLQAAQHFSLKELYEIYKKLFRLERAQKTGKGDPAGVFDILIAKL